jgi:hypothetical protein
MMGLREDLVAVRVRRGCRCGVALPQQSRFPLPYSTHPAGPTGTCCGRPYTIFVDRRFRVLRGRRRAAAAAGIIALRGLRVTRCTVCRGRCCCCGGPGDGCCGGGRRR